MNRKDQAFDESQPDRQRLELRQLAQQGDEAVIAYFLKQALAHKQTTTQSLTDATSRDKLPQVQVCLNGDWIKVVLHFDEAKSVAPSGSQRKNIDQVPEKWVIKTLIDQELLQLRLPRLHTIELQIYQTGTDPLWMEHFALGSQAQILIPRSTSTRVSHYVPNKESACPKPITKAGGQSLVIGLLLAAILRIFPLLTVLFYGFLIMVHEIGHALTHWIFGRPAIPTVNLLYGGGITLMLEQSNFILGLIYLALAFLLFLCRYYQKLFVLLVGLTGIYTLCLLTPLNQMLSIFMGHGMELVAMIICLYFAMAGYFCRSSIERPLYAMLGFFTLLSDLQFCWQLIFDLEKRAIYEEGIGHGLLDNDFVILARDYWHVDLSVVAIYFLCGCLLTPLIALLLFRFERMWVYSINSLLQPN